MKLKRLIIQGFKSFKDRTVINFDDGITGIVGPNGCGKSNIVDALFWVMGEQSPKHLRGNTMKDVIFSGSSKYSAASYAEATLVLENDEGKHIHIGAQVSAPSEIQLTRKLYRNGETEYRINGQPSRLRDIQEVFMDTGAGAKSYSIIAQGEIARLVNAKPEERRVMIEEVAGITKFKKRKQESLKKIEQTQLNLGRLQDLQQEIEKNLKALEKQAEKAEKARTLRDKIKRNEVIVESHKVFDILNDYRDGKGILSTKRQEIEEWASKKDILEIGLEEERYQKDEKTANIEELQKEFNEISRLLAGSEEKLNSLCRSQTDKEKQIETREKELTELEGELENRVNRLSELAAQKEHLDEQREEGFDTTELEERVETLKEELSLKEVALSELKSEKEKVKTDLDELEKLIFRNTSKLEEMASQLEDITEEIEGIEKLYSGVSTAISKEREEVNEAKEVVVEKEEAERELAQAVRELAASNKELEATYKAKSNELIKTESRLTSLRELNESLEGVKEGASNFIKDHPEFKLFGNLIKCDEEYTAAVQNLLSGFVHTLIPPQGTDLGQFKSWLASDETFALDMILKSNTEELRAETRERLDITLGGDVIALADVLKFTEEEERLKELCKGFFIAKNLNSSHIDKISAEIKFKGIASLDGKIVINNQQGTLVLSSFGAEENNGAIARNNLIEKLASEVEVLANIVNELEAKLANENEKLDNSRENLDALREELTTWKSTYAAKKSGLESKVAGFETNNTRLTILKNRKTETSKARLEMIEEEEVLHKKKDKLADQFENLSMRFEDDESELAVLRETYNEVRDEFQQKQMEAKSFGDRVNSLLSQIQDTEGQIERQTTRLDSTKNLIETYKTEIENIETELSDLEFRNKETAGVLQDKEVVLSELKDDFVTLLQSMQEREDEVKTLTQKINKNDKEIAEYEHKLGQYLIDEEQITRNIFEKHRIDLRNVIGTFLGYTEEDYSELSDITNMFVIQTEEGEKQLFAEEYEFSRRYGQDLRDCGEKLKNYRKEFNLLGEINWQAIEDYERQKLRFNFLNEQEAELKSSLADLELAISHIDEKSKERFKIAFSEVNTRFQKVFPIIFGGGRAELKVTGDINDAECGVDIDAQPPGKNMTNINLMSGGEKTLTAVSLIFSIFLVKPSPFCLLDEVDAPLDDANVGRFNELLREMSSDSQFILITHNKKTMELNDTLYGVTMQEPGVSKAVSVQLH